MAELGVETNAAVRVALQRAAHQWRTVASLRARKGRGSLAALSLGVYQLRVAALVPGHRTAGRAVRLPVFGNVALGRLLPGQVATFTTPTRTFPYVAQFTADSADPVTRFTVSNNNCRSVHFDFSGEDFFDIPDASVTLTVVQQTQDPVAAATLLKQFGTLDVALVPGQPWSLQTSEQGVEFFQGSCTSTGPPRVTAQRAG